METINSIREELKSINGFIARKESSWREIPYIWCDYVYESTSKIIAKYVFFQVDKHSWNTIIANKKQLMTDIIEQEYYTLDNDLRWNLYLVCVINDQDYLIIDQYEKQNYENNTLYTRNYLIPESSLLQRIPIGKVLTGFNKFKIVYPIDEWHSQLGEYSFCMEPFSDDILTGNLDQQKKRCLKHESNPHRIKEIRCLESIFLPQNFRAHFYQKDLKFPCSRFNLLYGANGSGKTSVLSAIELATTGKVFKPSTLSDSSEQSNVILKVGKQGNSFELKRPENNKEKKLREAEWYNSYNYYNGNNETDQGTRLNSLFHRFNYFSSDDSYRFASLPPFVKDVFSCLLFGEDTLEKWENIIRNKESINIIKRRLEEELSYYRKQIEKRKPFVSREANYDIYALLREYGLSTSINLHYEEIKKKTIEMLEKYKTVKGYAPIEDKTTAESFLMKVQVEIQNSRKIQKKVERIISRLQRLRPPVDVISSIYPPVDIALEKKISSTKRNEESLQKSIAKKERQFLQYKGIIEFWDRVCSWFPDTVTGEDFERKCNMIISAINEYSQIQENLKDYKEIKEKSESIELQLKRCLDIDRRISKLLPPQEYARRYIQQNIQQISQIFINLHVPQEFSRLDIENDEVVGVRNAEYVSLGNMSTGQRTALAFSVFFQLHLSNASVPQFILIDEPMANIDDLNALLLMDFLRELTITQKRQLFVTTANQNVAKLFRRKFSFLGEELQEIGFYRNSKDSCEVKQTKYDQKCIVSEKIL